MLEQMQEFSNEKPYTNNLDMDIPNNARNYCLPDIQGINDSFKVKIMLRYSKRMRATVIDAEIAERRTLISVRENFFPIELTTVSEEDLTVEEVKVYKIH